MKELEQKLRARLAELTHRSGDITRDLRQTDAPLPPDWEEQATSLENSEVLSALDVKTRDEIRQILDALARMAQGQHGFCASCGEKIPEGRLKALPYTTLCVSCA